MTPGAGRVAVIGGGIVGVSTAIWLRRGREVVLVDPGVAADRASFGNAGVLAACSVVPVTVPGLAAKAPKMVLDPNFPLFLRWGYLPRLLPWLLRYLSHATAVEAARIARGLAPLVGDAVAQHQALAEGTPAAGWLTPSGYLFAYPSRAAFEADAFGWGLRREAGWSWQEVEGPALRELDPALGPAIGFGVLVGEHGYVADPGGYLRDLAAHAARLGVTFVPEKALDLRLDGDGRPVAVATASGEISCAVAVVATGAWSGLLLRRIGLRIPIETERGYHVMIRDPSVRPRLPTMVTSGKFVATPMAEGVRCAGVVEFGGLRAPPTRRALNLVVAKLCAAYPAMRFTRHEEWLGHRPAPADSLPLIGQASGHPGLYLAFGHHHVGLTSGPRTGRLVAALVAGERPDIDLAPYSPDRFARH
ncbi:FAD-binding oxidoreductase [Inquilinus limosus]|uniref:NAD(P)/FAD-dependent oxidoreductase n=1 Tax=Inquilinus limosus TaxID=171674 RepID=UPI003F16FEB9